MREEVRDRGRLEHMLTAIGNVEEFTKDVSKESFVNSKLLFFAVVKNIEFFHPMLLSVPCISLLRVI